MRRRPECLWKLFSSDCRSNCLAWEHAKTNPVIPLENRSWKANWTANPDYLEFQGKGLLYYRGNGTVPDSDGRRLDRIAVAEVTSIGYNHLRFEDLNSSTFIIDVGKEGQFDCRHVLDPAAVVVGNQVYLYYSAIGNGPDSIGSAVSPDGIYFEKVGKVTDGRAPEVLSRDGKNFLLYQKKVKGEKGYRDFYLAYSEDGTHFTLTKKHPVFESPESGWARRLLSVDCFSRGNILT